MTKLDEILSRPFKQSSKEAVTPNNRILAVDDLPALLRLLQRGLLMHGFSVDAVSSCKESIELYQFNWMNYHCVILDMMMPEMTGNQLYKKLRAINPNLKAIFVSGSCPQELINDALSNGANYFLPTVYTFRISRVN